MWACATASFHTELLGNELVQRLSEASNRASLSYLYDCDFEGITPIYEHEDGAQVDILAVTGLAGHAVGSWKAPGRSELWLRDYLGDDIPGLRVLLYGYDTSLLKSESRKSIEDLGEMLLESITAFRTGTQAQRPIILIGHSLGGLLIKEALVHASKHSRHTLAQTCRSLLFFGVPNLGLRNEQLLGLVQGQPNELLIRDLVVDQDTEPSPFLKRMSAQFAEVCKGKYPVISFYELKLSPTIEKQSDGTLVRSGTKVLMVTRRSATGTGITAMADEDNVGLDEDHSGLVKFTSKNSGSYLKVKGRLNMLVAGIPKVDGAFEPRDSLHLILDVENALLNHMNETGLRPGDVVYGFNQLSDIAPANASLEWFTKSPEFSTWRNHGDNGSLWLHGRPGEGKTVVMHHLAQNRHYFGYKCDVVCVDCSPDHSEAILVASFVLQLAKHKHRVHRMREGIKSWDASMTQADLTQHLWKLLDVAITEIPDHGSVFLIDGIDVLRPIIRASFLSNFLQLQQDAVGQVKLRVIMSSRPYADIKEALALYQSLEPGKERNECLQSLHFKEWNARETRIDTYDGGSWIASHAGYKEWEGSPSSDLLWIEGKPGSGKSTLSKRIVTNLRAKTGTPSHEIQDNGEDDQDQNILIAKFYYSFRGGMTETSHELMLRSIVYQIWKQNRRLYPQIQDRYRQLKSNQSSDPPNDNLWSYRDLKAALESLSAVDFPLRIFIVVDGLDESDNDKRTDILELLKSLSRQEGQCVLKILVASRPENDIDARLKENRRVILQEVNREDIENWVHNSIAKIHDERREDETISPADKDRLVDEFSSIQNSIVEKSQGVFIWVSLVLQDLENLTNDMYDIPSLRERLDLLPEELGGAHGFYREIVNTLDRHRGQGTEKAGQGKLVTARRILAWVTFPKRPIELGELSHALATPPLLDDMDLSDNEQPWHVLHNFKQGIRKHCGGLVELRRAPSKYIVQLIHQTVREFLLDQSCVPFPASPYDLKEAEADREIASTCFRTMQIIFTDQTMQSSADKSFSRIDQVISSLSKSNLLPYSLQYLREHIQHLGGSGDDLSKKFQAFCKTMVEERKTYASLLLLQWIGRSYWYSATSIQTGISDSQIFLQAALSRAARTGKDPILETLLLLLANVNGHDQDGKQPLYHAASEGHQVTVQILVDSGADVNAQGGINGNALHAASDRGHREIVQLLLDKGADVNAQGGEYGNALQVASSGGHREIVQVLLEKGADVNAQGGRYGNALQVASFRGHREIVQLLLEKGEVQITETMVQALAGYSKNGLKAMMMLLDRIGDQFPTTATIVTTIIRHFNAEVTQLLLDKKGDQVQITENVVQAAAENSQYGLEVMQLLFDHVQVPLSTKSVALNRYALLGNVDIVKLLLDKDADWTIADKDGWTPLLNASYNGHIEIIKLLLRKDNKIDAADTYGHTALYFAAKMGNLAVADLLLSKGTGDINAVDNKHRTALLRASSAGHTAIVDLLLGMHADPIIMDDCGATCIGVASRNGHLEIVQRLFGHGAEWSVQDDSGLDALQLAVWEGRHDVESFLLSIGAVIPDDVFGFCFLFKDQ